MKNPSLTDTASRRYYLANLVDMLHEAEEYERDGRDAGAPEKKQRKPKKQAKPPERKKLSKTGSVRNTTTQGPRPVAKDAPVAKKVGELPGMTEPKVRKLLESGSR